MELYTDKYYINRIQSGDTECFACLLDRYSRQVFSLIVKIVGNREDAEELAQDTFMKVFKNLSSFKGDSSFSTWIYRIAYNTAISETRKKKQEFLSIDDTMMNNVCEENVAATMESDSSEIRLNKLNAALEKLLPDERAIVMLFYRNEKSIEEIAEITALSISNVKVKLFRIRKKLYVLLKEMENQL